MRYALTVGFIVLPCLAMAQPAPAWTGLVFLCTIVNGQYGTCETFHDPQAVYATRLLCQKGLRDELWRLHLLPTPNHAIKYECKETP